jgi:PEGA domain
MSMAHDLIVDQFRPIVEGEKQLATWYVQGHSDRLGDRLLMFDNTSAPSWEILRFKPALASDSRFETALRERMEQLSTFRHSVFPQVRQIKQLGREDGLAVASTYAPGARLTEALKKPCSPVFAARLIRLLVPALAALQEFAPGISHGALDADRIVITGDGQLMIREHMVGSAIESLGLSAAELWTDFGILTFRTPPTLDRRHDVAQLALVALSLMAGRRIRPDEYPHKVVDLLNEIAEKSSWQSLLIFQPLRNWLERALWLDDRPFDSAKDANDALSEFPEEPPRTDDYFGSPASSLQPPSNGADAVEDGRGRRGGRSPRFVAPRAFEGAEKGPAQSPAADTSANLETRFQLMRDPVAFVQRYIGGAMPTAAIIVALLALGEAVMIGRLLYARAATEAPAPVGAAVLIESPEPGANVLVDDQPVGVTPLQLNVGPRIKSIRVLPPPAATLDLDQKVIETTGVAEPAQPAARTNDKLADLARLPAAQRRGAFRLSSPVELHVLDGDRVLGSSGDGPIVATAGRHEFEFVNSAIGYRARRVIEVRPGQITSLSVTLPNGTMNINAVPWAAVWIDGNPVGDTPLGNLSISLGEHDIVFRHPQLGERRERTLVRADGVTRVTVNLQQ